MSKFSRLRSTPEQAGSVPVSWSYEFASRRRNPRGCAVLDGLKIHLPCVVITDHPTAFSLGSSTCFFLSTSFRGGGRSKASSFAALHASPGVARVHTRFLHKFGWASQEDGPPKTFASNSYLFLFSRETLAEIETYSAAVFFFTASRLNFPFSFFFLLFASTLHPLPTRRLFFLPSCSFRSRR